MSLALFVSFAEGTSLEKVQHEIGFFIFKEDHFHMKYFPRPGRPFYFDKNSLSTAINDDPRQSTVN